MALRDKAVSIVASSAQAVWFHLAKLPGDKWSVTARMSIQLSDGTRLEEQVSFQLASGGVATAAAALETAALRAWRMQKGVET